MTNYKDAEISELEGETIVSVHKGKISKSRGSGCYDDEPYLIIKMKSGKIFRVVSEYGRYSGQSEDEYPRFIYVEKRG